MPHMETPTAMASRQGSMNVASQADNLDLTKSLISIQHHIAAERIARRFALTMPVAIVVAELAGIGRQP